MLLDLDTEKLGYMRHREVKEGKENKEIRGVQDEGYFFSTRSGQLFK